MLRAFQLTVQLLRFLARSNLDGEIATSEYMFSFTAPRGGRGTAAVD